MASNGFFEFLGDLKGLYDEASRRRNWAQQYNPYNGGSSWWRGLGAINQMMDRNAEDRALKTQRQEYKAGTDNTPPTTGIGANADGVFGIGQQAPDISVGVSAMPPQKDNGFSSIFNGNSFKGGSLVNPPTPSVSSGSDSLAQGTEGQSNASARDLSRYLSNDYNIANWMQADDGRGVSNPYISALRYASKIAPLVQAAKEERLKNLFMASSNPDLSDEERKQARIQLAGELNKPDLLGELDFANWQRQKAKEEFEHGKSMWGIDDAIKSTQLESAKERLRGAGLDNDVREMNLIGNYAGVNNEGKTWVRKDGVDLSNLQPRAVAGLNHVADIFRQMFPTAKSPMLVTSGRDSNKHADGKYSHYTGWKVDIADDMAGTFFNDKANRDKFAQALAQIGVIVRDEWIPGNEHLDLNFQNYHGGNLGNRLGQKNTKNTKNTKETETPYDSQALADAINATYTEGKTRGTDAERAEIGKKMSGAVDIVASPYDNWQTASEKLYNYYHNDLGASKGWTLNSEEFSHLVGRAIHDYYLRNTQTDIPVNTVAQYVFNKFDPESKAKQEEANKWKEQNKDAPKTSEEQARKVLGVTKDGRVEHVDATPKKAGSKTSQNLDQPITFGGIMDKLRVGNDKNRNENMTWKWK